MADTFQFRLVTPTGVVYEGSVEQAIMVGALGEFGVLANHVDFVTSLSPGVLTIHAGDGGATEYLLSGGLAEVKDGAMTALADDALPVAAVDATAAASEVQAAAQKLSEMSSFEPGYAEAERALQFAQARSEIDQRRRVSR